MRKARLLFRLIPLLWLAACQVEGRAPGVYSGTLMLEGQHIFTAGETLTGALVVLDGRVELREGAWVAGPVLLFGGELSIDGQVAGDVTAFSGSMVIGPSAQVDGDLRAGSGALQLSPQAQVSGEVLTGPASGVDLDDLFPERSRREQLIRIIPSALLLAVLAYLGASLSPRPLERVMRAATGHPVVSAAMGLLVGIVGPVFFVVMAYTLILIPVTVIGLLLGILMIGFGQVALGVWAGRLLERWAGWRLRTPVSAFLGAFLFRIILSTLALIPAVGSLLELLFAIIALGAVTLTRFGLSEFVMESAQLRDDFF